jgi:hypothetical protein
VVAGLNRDKPQEEPSTGNPSARICKGKSLMAELLDYGNSNKG